MGGWYGGGMARERPNIVMIVIDDLGWADLGCFGSSFYETPRLDRLAADGLRFTDAYASCPVCSPTRASIMTGKYPANVGITNYIAGNAWGKLMGVPYFHELPREETTVADALRAGGYQTWHLGKWHLGPEGNWPEDRGFDVNLGGCHMGMPSGGNHYFSPYDIPTLHNGPEGEFLTDRLTDEAVALMRGRDRDRPFFMNLCHYAVHTPIQAPAELVAKYQRKARELGLDPDGGLEVGEAFPCLHKKDQRVARRRFQSHPTYAAMVENLDTNIGLLLDALDAEGLGKDTLVMFTSDNGGLSTAEGSPTCNAPLLEGKGWMYEGGNRVSQIARWPGVIPAGTTTAEPVTSTDFFPTCLEAAGLELMPQQHEDGVSMLAHMRGQAETLGREAIFWHYPHYSNQGDAPAAAVRAGDLKLIQHFEDDRIELFDLTADLSESRDLAAERPHDVARLRGMLEDWQSRIGAKIPDVNPDYQAMLSGAKPCPDGTGRIPGDDR